ncbi:MAG: hypothetical protein AAB512_05100 [Patescibacteria group bacterium]
MSGKLKLTEGIILGSIAAVVFVVAITIVAELAAPLKGWLKNTFYHHWIGKSLIAVIVFAGFSVLAFAIPHKASLEGINRLLLVLVALVLLGALVIFGFFSYETFLK